jgi:hypothetical protein
LAGASVVKENGFAHAASSLMDSVSSMDGSCRNGEKGSNREDREEQR